VYDDQITATSSLADGYARVPTGPSIFDRTLQNILNFVLFNAMLMYVRIASFRIDVKPQVHCAYKRRSISSTEANSKNSRNASRRLALASPIGLSWLAMQVPVKERCNRPPGVQ
jgi:hypothetical protein